MYYFYNKLFNFVLCRYCRPFAEEASQLAGTLVSVEALVEAWQDTQENVKLLLSHTLASGFSQAPELRARYRKVSIASLNITKVFKCLCKHTYNIKYNTSSKISS